ncbi:MAG TPA: response regulator transcription factor [Planctomycetes bacterium]|nr:response regulator transcription factor [Fuerstiella sp.]HIK91324.1 response regulator transcription factor [Planctomycetota bacterium]
MFSTVTAIQADEIDGVLAVEETESPQVERLVYVLDDEIQVLEVIELQLNAVGYSVITYASAAEFLENIHDLLPGVVVSDQRMPGVSGLNVQQQLRKFSSRFQLILLSGYPETRVVVEAMRQGAVTVLDKPYNRDQLLASLEEAFDALARAATDDHGLPAILSDGTQYLDRLSSRERQVVDLVYKGETNKSIGIQLGISIKTVEKHRGKAMKKMEVSSLAELIRLMERELATSTR